MYEKILTVMPLTPEPNFKKWENTIRLIRERNKIPPQRIVEIFDWANQHDFWQTNIRSPTKLRKQIPVLDAQMRKDNEIYRPNNRKLSLVERVQQNCDRELTEIRED